MASGSEPAQGEAAAPRNGLAWLALHRTDRERRPGQLAGRKTLEDDPGPTIERVRSALKSQSNASRGASSAGLRAIVVLLMKQGLRRKSIPAVKCRSTGGWLDLVGTEMRTRQTMANAAARWLSRHAKIEIGIGALKKAWKVYRPQDWGPKPGKARKVELEQPPSDGFTP